MAVMSRLVAAAASPSKLLLRRVGPVSNYRCYGSASAVQYDYYDDDVEEYSYVKDLPRTESLASLQSGRGVQWVMLGEPGAKKHVYAERLSELLEVPLISMGSLVRQELSPRSSLYKQIAQSVTEGKLVQEDVIFAMLSKRLEEGYCKGETGFILEGIPRTRIQAEILDQIVDIDLVVNFKCTEVDSMKKSILTENISSCQDVFGIGNTGCTSSSLGNSCKEKLENYAEQAKPLEDYYRKQKKLLDFQVAGAPGETWRGLLAALHLQHMNAAAALHSSQKLTS